MCSHFTRASLVTSCVRRLRRRVRAYVDIDMYVFWYVRLINFIHPPHTSYSLLCFPWWRILLLCYFVLALHHPRAPCETDVYVWVFPLRAVFSLAFFMLTFFFLLLFLPFFRFVRFRFGHRLFHPVFFLWVLCCLLGFGFCCDSLRMVCTSKYVFWILIRAYADLTFLFLSEAYACVCFRYMACIIFCFLFIFPPEVIFRSRVIWACPVTTDCIVVAMS